MTDHLLDQIARFRAEIARIAATAEVVGPFEIYRAPADAWQHLPRPAIDATAFAPIDIGALLARLDDGGDELAFTFIPEYLPQLAELVGAAELDVTQRPSSEAATAPASLWSAISVSASPF